MNSTRASATARLIAAGTVMAAREQNATTSLPAEAVALSERFLSTTASDRFLLFTVRSRIGRAGWRWIERLTIPGIVNHWMRRKQSIEQYARQAASDGFTQLVIVGSGLDTLAFRMHAEGVFESTIAFDHPATQMLIEHAVGDSLTVELIPVDLRADDLPGALSRSRQFDPDRQTVFIVEGVLMYLPERTVRSALRAIATAPCPRLRLVATYMDAVADSTGIRCPIGFRPQSPIVPLWLRIRGEEMLWSIEDSLLSEFLAGLGWRLLEISRVAMGGHIETTDAKRPDGENMFVAEREPRPRD
jgi:methyltransferase (TIGR00027 family)